MLDYNTRDREGQAEAERPIGQLQTAKAALDYIMAGNAYFTLRSKATGTRYTYRVSLATCKKCGKSFTCECGIPLPHFVNLLTGPENTSDYTYLGVIRQGKFWLTGASKMQKTSKPVRAIEWTLGILRTGDLPDNLEIWHDGNCGRCGRTLTVPESVERGIGPECAARMGL